MEPSERRPTVKHANSVPPSVSNPRPSVMQQRTDSSGRIYPHSMARSTPKQSSKLAGPSTTARPSLVNQRTTSSMQTEYVNMLLALDAVPRFDNWMASFFTWILLAGFVILPGTFNSLQQVQAGNSVETVALHAVQNIPLFVIGYACCAIGAAGMIWLWWRWNANYVWLLQRIFLPGFLNGLAGVLTTIANVFGAQSGRFTVTSETTIVVTGATTIACGLFLAFYSLIKLRVVKQRHDMEVGRVGTGLHGEGVIQEVKRQAKQPVPEVTMFGRA